jgi:hypothetical protein
LAVTPAVDQPAVRRAEEQDNSAFGAMLAAAGLLAVQKPQTRPRRLLDREAMAYPLDGALPRAPAGRRSRIEW